MKKKKLGVLGVVIFLSCAAILIFAINANGSDSRLTEKQINDLRAEYPICYGDSPNANSIPPTIDEVIDGANTFVYGKVIGEVNHYYVDISTGHEILDKKRVENGLSNTYEFYEYTLEVISDTQGVIDMSQITITRNAEFEDYDPVLEAGMKVVTPLSRIGISEDEPSRYNYRKYGFYYVTEDGYVLSAFDEDASFKSRGIKDDKNSGIKVDSLMKQLKQKKDDMLKSAAVTDGVSE